MGLLIADPTRTRDRTDGKLLAEFLDSGRPEPFEEIVRRYGGLVAAVCRRHLGAAQDAEDAAQAVFLTLAHRAKSLRASPSLAGWLHHVARTISLNAIRSRTRRERREREAGHLRRETMDPEQHGEELQRILDRELDALPEKYRVPLILHYLQDRSQEEIAREMGCQVGTISTWLHRGREALRGRLSQAGVAVSGAALLALLGQHAAAAELSASAVAVTVKAATLVASGKTAAIPSHVAMLMQAGLKAAAVTNLKAMAAAAMILTMTGAGAGVAVYTMTEPPPQETGAADLTPERFAAIHSTILTQKGEAPWKVIPWEFCFLEARKKAAEQGKPIFIWAIGGEPTGAC